MSEPIEDKIRRNPPEVLTLVETAMYLQVSERTARELLKSGTIPHKRVGVQIRVRLEDLKSYMQTDPHLPKWVHSERTGA